MSERYKKTKIASILGILGNIFLLVIKGTISIITGSKSMIADSLNSASDILSSILTFVGNKIASKPKDDDHHLGHGKAEYIYSLLISIIMILLALSSFKDSLLSLITNSKFHFSYWLIIVCIATIITKFSLYIYTSRIAKKYHNVLMNANSKDHRNDCIVTSFTLLSAILSIYNIYFIDSIIGIGISIWIFITGIKIFKESYDVLMDKCIDNDTKDRVLELIKHYPEIKKIQHFTSAPVGYRYQISFTIFVDGNMSTFDSHEIADKLEDEIEEKFEEMYLTIIHVNPISENKEG